MQSLFYMKEEGDAQARVGRLNLALKRYHMLFKVISTFPTELPAYFDATRRLMT